MSTMTLARPSLAPALERLDLLLYRQILRLRAHYQLSLDELRGLYISDAQVDDLILRDERLGQIDIAEIEAKESELQVEARAALAGDASWVLLTRLYGLNAFEQDVLLLCLAPELASKYLPLFGYLNNDVSRQYATLELALALFSNASTAHADRGDLSAHGTLRSQGLLQPAANGQLQSSLRTGFTLADPVRDFLLGHSSFNTGWGGFCESSRATWRPWPQWPFADDLRAQFEAMVSAAREPGGPRFLVVEAAAGSGAVALCGNALSQLGLAQWHIDGVSFNADRDNALVLRSLCQAAIFDRAALLVDERLASAESSSRGVTSLLLRELSGLWRRCSAPLICVLLVGPGTCWRELCGDRPYLHIEVPAPTLEQREGFWHWHLAQRGLAVEPHAVAAVSDYFQLDWQQVKAAANALACAPQSTVSREQLFAAAKQQSVGELGTLASKVDKPYLMEDLVLPNAVHSRVQEIIAAIRARRRVFEDWGLRRKLGGGRGLVALFGGTSGTGKTMTAGVIANAIGLDLYRVELAGVVSKYIGETEKNLDRIFDAARQSNCILLLDEADALFGKRTEVSDAHDRYANIEVAYLLQKLEGHDGIVILTTNLAKNIDAAFTRRLQFVIEFPRPDVQMRERLWRGMLDGGLPLSEDIDFGFLSRQFDNSGGDIRNMVLDAALMAAAGDQMIDMALLLRAAARQMMKQGKVPSAVEFKHYFSLVDKRGA